VLEGKATLGIANVVPILVTVAFVAASMRFFGVPFNAITATILAITIGLGIDYSVHVTHRFADEREHRDLLPALDRTVRGTGGALLGSMLTTVFGIGVLALALFTAIQQFGLITGLSILYAFLASVLVLPSALVVWDHFASGHRSIAPLFGIGTPAWRETGATAAGASGAASPAPPAVESADEGSSGPSAGATDLGFNGGELEDPFGDAPDSDAGAGPDEDSADDADAP
jgi:uncharacterized membrane protein YdfJ with MMPL/SSD domain